MLAAGFLAGTALVTSDAAAPGQTAWATVAIPGQADELIRGFALGPDVGRWRVLFEATRRMEPSWEGRGRYPRPAADAWARLTRGDPGDSPSGEDALPIILPAEAWSSLVFGRPVPQSQLAGTILSKRSASLLYRGLFQLDPETLAFVERYPEVLRALSEGPADAFAVFARALRIRGGRMLVPGGAEAEPSWESVVGERSARPERFIPKLLSKDDGRLALFYDAVAGLDPPAQRFALDVSEPSLARRLERAAALYEAFAREGVWWRPDRGAFRRPVVDAARVLAEVAVDTTGHMAEPNRRPFWGPIFGVGGTAPNEPASELVDAAWLVEHVAHGPASLRRERLTQVAFAQRVFGDAPERSLADAATSVRGLAAFPALILVLDRIGVRDPSIYAAAVRVGERLSGLRDLPGRTMALVQFQTTVAVLDRARYWSRALDDETTDLLLRSLFSVRVTDRGYEGGLASWWKSELLPALRRFAGSDSETCEGVVARALSGATIPSRESLPFEWEGLRFRSRPGEAELHRFEAVRRRQGGATLDDALSCGGVSGARADDPDALLADVLRSIVYAPHLGPPDGPALAGSNVARRHSLGVAGWRLPAEVVGPGVPWHVEGSLLGLDLTLARRTLRRVGTEMPRKAPGLASSEVLGYAQAVALMSPFAVQDDDVAAIADALRRGRARARALATPEDVETAARDARLEAWRREGLRWAVLHERDSLERFFTLGELLALGWPASGVSADWGTPDLLMAGSLRLRPPRPRPFEQDSGRPMEDLMPACLPDLSIRVASDLNERALPASLAPYQLARLIRDFADQVEPLDAYDRLALARYARDVSSDRVDDFIASLSDGGPLLPATTP